MAPAHTYGRGLLHPGQCRHPDSSRHVKDSNTRRVARSSQAGVGGCAPGDGQPIRSHEQARCSLSRATGDRSEREQSRRGARRPHPWIRLYGYLLTVITW